MLRVGNELYYLSRTPHGIHLSNLFVQALAILAMSFRDQKDEPLIPTWDGEVAGWAEYSRRVRLCWAQTPSHKRYTLGPKLVLRLKGKAWEVASTVDHSQLEKTSGTPYLLKFLKAKLGRLPVPDVGQHLDELFVKSRRPVGMDLLSWCNQLRENYRRVQRALARTMTTKLEKGTQTDPTGTSPFLPLLLLSNQVSLLATLSWTMRTAGLHRIRRPAAGGMTGGFMAIGIGALLANMARSMAMKRSPQLSGTRKTVSFPRFFLRKSWAGCS